MSDPKTLNSKERADVVCCLVVVGGFTICTLVITVGLVVCQYLSH